MRTVLVRFVVVDALWISSSQSTRRPVRSTDKVIEFGADVRGTLRLWILHAKTIRNTVQAEAERVDR